MLSPDLYAFFVVDQPMTAALHEAYADDSHDAESSSNMDEAANRLNVALTDFTNWTKEKSLTIAPTKSTLTPFTPDTHQSRRPH